MNGIDPEVCCAPTYLRCPISLDLMNDPVTLSTGITYDRHCIETWLDAGNNVCPVTNQILHSRDTVPNHALRRIIEDWCVANKFERIPTPLDPAQLNSILEKISLGDMESINQLCRLRGESERNKRCILSSNASSVLAAVFAKHSARALNRSQNSLQICEEALRALSLTFPFNSPAMDLLVLQDPISCLVRILRESDKEGKKNAVAVVQEMVSKEKYRDVIGGAVGLTEGLVGLLREPICPTATKASLAAIYNIGVNKVKVVEGGGVGVVVETLVQAERSVCERALLALDVLCNCTEGRMAASANALTVPVLVRKILRESHLASAVAVSILWNICQNSSDGVAVGEAIQAGAFDKLLLLLQLGCSQRTKEKASNLLKLFNAHTHHFQCAHSINLHFVKRSY